MKKHQTTDLGKTIHFLYKRKIHFTKKVFRIFRNTMSKKTP